MRFPKRLMRSLLAAVLLAGLAGCALLPKPTMQEVSNEFSLDLLSKLITALGADDFEYFMSCYDLDALAASRGLGPITSGSLPLVKNVVREHFNSFRVLKDNMGTELKFYSVIGTRVGPMHLSINGAVSSTPIIAGTPEPGPLRASKDRGFWIISAGGRRVKVRLVRPGPWKIEDMEWSQNR